jgi:PII-like signaling protein
MIRTHSKKRLEIVIESPLLRRVIGLIDGAKVSGYSVLPIIAGNGHSGRWEATGLVSESGKMFTVVCILDQNELDLLLSAIYPIVERQVGILAISDVQVIRAQRF